MGVWLPPSPDVLDPEAVPYFNWDAPITNTEVRRLLAEGPDDARLYWMARVMREARYDDVWTYVTLAQVVERLDELLPLLGRRRELWSFLVTEWRRAGVVPG